MISQQHWLNLCVIVSALLSGWMGVASGQKLSIQLIPQHPVIRGSVTLTVTGITGGNIRSFFWNKGADTSVQNQILAYIPFESDPVQLNGPKYHNRVRAFPNTSLLISSLERNDEGDYIVQVQTDTALQASVTLTVYELVVKPTITASPSIPNPKENDTVTLTCTAANAERLVWSRDGTSLPSSASLSSDNRTVTFSRITRMDSGSYQCEAQNHVSMQRSAPYILTVAYGPENVKLTNQSNGDTIRLKCSAESLPSPSFQWIYYEKNVNVQQDTITVQKGGNYTCLVYNSITQLNASAAIYVYVPTGNEFLENADGHVIINIGGVISAVVGAVILMGLVAAIIYFSVRWRQRKKRLDDLQSTDYYENTSKDGAVYVNAHALQSSQYEMTMPGNQEKRGQESVYQELTHKDGSIYNTIAGANRNY